MVKQEGGAVRWMEAEDLRVREGVLMGREFLHPSVKQFTLTEYWTAIDTLIVKSEHSYF